MSTDEQAGVFPSCEFDLSLGVGHSEAIWAHLHIVGSIGTPPDVSLFINQLAMECQIFYLKVRTQFSVIKTLLSSLIAQFTGLAGQHSSAAAAFGLAWQPGPAAARGTKLRGPSAEGTGSW